MLKCNGECQQKPTDYVISTGRQESVRKFVELSAKAIGWNKGENTLVFFGKVKD